MAPDVQYGFDHHIAIGNITGDVYAFFVYFNEEDVNSWYDSLEHGIDEESNRGFRYESTKKFLNWFYKDRDDQRAYCVVDGIWSHHYMADEVTRGVIHNLIKNGSDKVADQIIEEVNKNPLAVLNSDDIYKAYSKNTFKLARRSQRFDLEHLRMVANPEYAASIKRVEYIPTDQDKFRKSRTLSKTEKKVLKRSADILDQTLGPKKSSIFVSGEKITVEGQRFDFKCGKGFSANHISLSVYDKKDNKHLVNLCWYVENTPAMDQIAALAMLVMAGEEDEIIQVGNYMSQTDVLLERYPEFKNERSSFREQSLDNMLSNIPYFNDESHLKYMQVLNNTQDLVRSTIQGGTTKILERNKLLFLEQ